MGKVSKPLFACTAENAALHIDISEVTLVTGLKREAQRKKQSVERLLSHILSDYLEELEDAKAVKAAIKRDKGKPTISLKELERKYGLEG